MRYRPKDRRIVECSRINGLKFRSVQRLTPKRRQNQRLAEPNSPAAETGPESHDEDVGTSLRNYWLMVMERKWYALAIFLLTVLITITYTFLATPIYQSVAMVQVLRRGSQVLHVVDVVDSSVTSDTDFNTQMKLLESFAMVQNVLARLNEDELRHLTEPYKKRFGQPKSAAEIIYENRKIVYQRLTLMLAIQFRHPDPKTAARIANLFAEEYIGYNSRIRVEESLKAIDELKDRADQQRKRVDEIANSLQAYRQRGNLISLVQSKDIVTERLKALNMMATQTNARLKEAEVRWTQVQEWTKAGKDLKELPFIASLPRISQLAVQITNQKITIAQLEQRYRSKHPRLNEALNTLSQAELEMKAALESASASVKSEYDNAQQNDVEARKALADQESKSLELDKSGVEYDNLNRDFRVNEQLLESMMTRMREASVTSSIETQGARIIDRAFEPLNPVYPKVALTIALGIAGGAFLGLGFAFLIAMVDDRVKNTFDVETLIGLPLVGLIPHIDRMEQPDKAQIVSNGADRMIVESFLSLYSTLRINDESRNAKFILITSTMPGEGKSFVSTNTALTFASQGHRTVIVDCDLRKPNIHTLFRLRTSVGLIGLFSENAALDDIIVRNVHPNLDVITAGGRAKNPTLILNSAVFEAMVSELGKRYDRVIFDTPPLGAVSDALNILPLMDGAIYTIRYNRVKRRAVQRCANRLFASNIPVFGAVLNDSEMGAADYYGEYHDKSYAEYYNVNVPEDALAPHT